MSANPTQIVTATRQDAAKYHGSIDLNHINEAEARRLMSAEHKALGYRPPPGSLAAEAQAAAAKHSKEVSAGVSADELRKAALEDAQRILSQRDAENGNGASIDLSTVGKDEARKLVSLEHKALGYRPPAGSIAAEAQSAATKHPGGESGVRASKHTLQLAALEDATQIVGGDALRIDLNCIGDAEARKIMSEEHRALGYRPPAGSLAAQAQAAAAKHPKSHAGLDAVGIAKAAVADAKNIEEKRKSVSPPGSPPTVDSNLATVARSEVHALESDEQKTSVYCLPSDSLAVQAQSIVDEHTDEPAAASKDNIEGLDGEDVDIIVDIF